MWANPQARKSDSSGRLTSAVAPAGVRAPASQRAARSPPRRRDLPRESDPAGNVRCQAARCVAHTGSASASHMPTSGSSTRSQPPGRSHETIRRKDFHVIRKVHEPGTLYGRGRTTAPESRLCECREKHLDIRRLDRVEVRVVGLPEELAAEVGSRRVPRTSAGKRCCVTGRRAELAGGSARAAIRRCSAPARRGTTRAAGGRNAVDLAPRESRRSSTAPA